MEINFIDNSDAVLAEMLTAKLRALERCGQKAEDYAKKLAPTRKESYGGNLKNSITHTVIEETAYIGSVVDHAPYVEMGTGKYTPGGRQDPWVYQDDEGNWHRTEGVKARPFMKPAVANHQEEYIHIMKEELEGE